MTEPQVWALIALFAGMLATVSGLVVRVVRSEIGGLRAEMTARFEAVDSRFDTVDARMDARFEAVDSRFDTVDARMDARFEAVGARFDAVDRHLGHLDRDVSALTKHIFGADQG